MTNNILGINHITLSVRSLESSLHFYTKRLGFRCLTQWAEGAHLEGGSLWLCLSQEDAHAPAKGYTHIAFTVNSEAMQHFEQTLLDIPRWQDNTSEGPSLYILDPDGHKLELHTGTLESRLAFLSCRR